MFGFIRFVVCLDIDAVFDQCRRFSPVKQILFSCTIAEHEQILQSQWKVKLCFAVFLFPFLSQVYLTAVGKYLRFVSQSEGQLSSTYAILK